MHKGLVYIGKVISVSPIEGADRIESIEVVCGEGGKWRGTAQKGQFSVGSLSQVYLQDSLLPRTEEFSFMEKHGYRVRMMRFKGVPSEVPIVEKSLDGNVGDDVTFQSGVTKYEKPLPANMSGDALGNFPSFIPKTDEPNFQSVPEMVAAMQGVEFYSTVKCDGSSATIYNYEGHFGCCSRNLELKDTGNNAIWNIARQYNLENNLASGLAIQFEVCGPGIQGNPMGLGKVEPRLFNVYDILDRCYLGFNHVVGFSMTHGFPMVDIVDSGSVFSFDSDDALRQYAQGVYPNGKPREGVVIRPMNESGSGSVRTSFKIINLLYKEK